MTNRFALGLTILLGTCVGSTTVMAAALDSVPASGQLVFDVIRKGKDVGDYKLNFTRKGQDLTVHLKTDVAVRVPVVGVSMYTFRQDSTENWKGGKLAALSSTTDDNGKHHKISSGPSPLTPASLWDADMVGGSQVLNTVDGSTQRVSVRDRGIETVTTGHGPTSAHHFSVSGGLDREVWYADGVLVRVRFAADDGSTVEYVLR